MTHGDSLSVPLYKKLLAVELMELETFYINYAESDGLVQRSARLIYLLLDRGIDTG